MLSPAADFAKDFPGSRNQSAAVLNSMDAGLDLDPSAFFDEFYPRVFRYLAAATGASTTDLDDLVQETLLHAWKNRARFRGDASPATWVIAIARNRVRMRRRTDDRRSALERSLESIDSVEIPEEILRSEEAARAVRRALEALDPLHAEVLLKRYFEGRTIRQISEDLHETEKAVESRLHRARQSLRERLLQGGPDDF